MILVWITFILEFSHSLLEIQILEQQKFWSIIFLWMLSLNIVHFHFLRDIGIGMHYLPEFDMHALE